MKQSKTMWAPVYMPDGKPQLDFDNLRYSARDAKAISDENKAVRVKVTVVGKLKPKEPKPEKNTPQCCALREIMACDMEWTKVEGVHYNVVYMRKDKKGTEWRYQTIMALWKKGLIKATVRPGTVFPEVVSVKTGICYEEAEFFRNNKGKLIHGGAK